MRFYTKTPSVLSLSWFAWYTVETILTAVLLFAKDAMRSRESLQLQDTKSFRVSGGSSICPRSIWKSCTLCSLCFSFGFRGCRHGMCRHRHNRAWVGQRAKYMPWLSVKMVCFLQALRYFCVFLLYSLAFLDIQHGCCLHLKSKKLRQLILWT
jgi:hypothetical protein